MANTHHVGAFDGFNLQIAACIAEREFFVSGRLEGEEREGEEEQVCC